MMKTWLTGTTFLVTTLISAQAYADDHCAADKTLTEGVLTIATSNPAYYPWVIDNDPASGQGFEAAFAYALAERMGFAAEQVSWVNASFDQSIQPGAKDFDVNLQQFSITEERDKIVDFSSPYYSAAMAVLTRQGIIDQGATPEIESLKGLLWGADANTTGLSMIQGLIAPDADPLLYDDNVNVVEAMKANQIDAALFDFPTALYLSAVSLDDGVILGQFPADRSETPDQFGMLMEEGNPIKACVDEAIASMQEDGSLAALEAEWLQEGTGVPLIQ